ncbi:MAG: hypothetical protein CL461_07880, partial [Acidimicrobiaceae bacterium]|nr:hypothetical protein [Acidimicrobiaceae bacterium]
HPFLNKNKLLFFGYILVCGIIGTTGAVLLGVEINIQTVIAVTVWAFFVLGFIGAVIMTTFDGK